MTDEDFEGIIEDLETEINKVMKIAGTLSDYVEGLTTDGFGLDKEVVEAVEELDKMWRNLYGN